MKIVAVCQARLGSTRLPNKMLLPLAGAPLVQRVLERVARATRLDDVVLAVPMRDREAFTPYTTLASVYAYPGDEADLVGRYLCAADIYQADVVVRIPCDNPCVEPMYIDEAVRMWLDNEVSFYSNTTSIVSRKHGPPLFVDGLGAEVFSMSRLKWLDQKTSGTPSYREHPHTAFLYDAHPADLRLDVNTQADYDFIADIYDHCYPKNPQFTIADILAYLDTKKVPA